jgi:hypothetical protein
MKSKNKERNKSKDKSRCLSELVKKFVKNGGMIEKVSAKNQPEIIGIKGRFARIILMDEEFIGVSSGEVLLESRADSNTYFKFQNPF